MIPRTSSGLIKFRPVRKGSRIALVAPASPFGKEDFELGAQEIRRLGLEPVWDEDVFERQAFTAGRPRVRVMALLRALDKLDADAVVAVRGGYGSVELLPLLDTERVRNSRTAFVGYSDVTSIHSYLGAVAGLASVHGAMLEGRLSTGPDAYDPVSWLKSLSAEPLGEMAPEGLEVLSPGFPGIASGALVGGTLTQLLASFGTPYEFNPSGAHVLFLDEVNERPYRLHRMLMQLRLSGRLQRAAAVIFGQLPGCDEPGGKITARDVIKDVLFQGFQGPVLFGFPSGHTTSPSLSMPLGVQVRVVGNPHQPVVIFDEAAAAD
jgi:muramoyltetrapeptide carboxypeptidase